MGRRHPARSTAAGVRAGAPHAAQAPTLTLFGHQLTLQLRPEQVLPREHRGVRHFGFILVWIEWEALADRVQQGNPHCVLARELRAPGSFEEHAKLLLEDQSGNLIEIKAYRELESICPALR